MSEDSERVDPDNGWRQFHDKEVLLQLKTQYVGVNPENMLPQTVTNDAGETVTGPNGAPMLNTTPFMKGTLFVEKDESGLVLKLVQHMGKTQDDKPIRLLVTIAPSAVSFCTTYDVQRIVTG